MVATLAASPITYRQLERRVQFNLAEVLTSGKTG
jgi:hypothetical protein